MGPLTEYGKILRHIRVDLSELLGVMAKKLNVSPAYLSSIESGQRTIPSDFTDKIVSMYSLSDETKEELLRAEAASNEAVTINLSGATSEQIDATVMFAREVKRMSVEELRELAKKLKERKGK